MKDKEFEEKCAKSAMCTVVKKGVEKGIEKNEGILNSALLEKVEEICKCEKMNINTFIEKAVERAIAGESKKSEETVASNKAKKNSMDAIMEKAVERGIKENELILESSLLEKVENVCKCKKMSVNDFIEKAVERAIEKER